MDYLVPLIKPSYQMDSLVLPENLEKEKPEEKP